MESKKIKILAIDDNPDNLITIKALIMEAFTDALVFTASNGLTGLELAVSEDPDVILLDIIMPDMDGFEVCQKLKADCRSIDIPVVFVTALKGDKASRIHGLEVGAEAFISKPIDESELVAQIRAMVKIKTAKNEKLTEKKRLADLVTEKTHELRANHIATLNLLDDLKNENEARKKSEEALRESEARFRAVAQSANDAIITIDSNGKLVGWNNGAEKIFGYTVNEVFGLDVSLIIPKHYIEHHINGVKRIERGGEQHCIGKTIEILGLSKNGNEFPIEMSLADWDSSSSRFYTAIIRDISDRKIAEKTLRDSEEKYRFMTENSSDVIWHLDCNFLCDYISPADEKMRGFHHDEVIGTSLWNVLKPEGVEIIQQVHLKRLADEKKGIVTPTVQFELEQICKDGSWIWTEASSTVHFNEEGELVGYHGVTHNVSARKRAEEAMRASEEKYRSLVQYSSDPIFSFNLDGTYRFVNEAFAKPYGLTPEHIIGKSPYDIMHVEDAKIQIAHIREIFKTGNKNENEVKTSNATEGVKYLLTMSDPVKNEQGQILYITCISKDITERKVAEIALNIEKQKAETYLNVAEVILVAFDKEAKITLLNRKGYQVLGYDPGELEGKDWFRVCLPADEYANVENVYKNILAGKIESFKYYENRIITKTGEERTIAWHNTWVLNEDGEITGTFSSGEDITERKKADIKIQHLSRLYALLSQINQAIVRTKKQDELFQTICQVAVEFGQFRMAWIGITDETNNVVKPNAHAGYENGYLKKIQIANATDVYGKGPTGAAMNSGKIVTCNDIATDKMMLPWKSDALKRGYHSSVAIPFKRNGKIFGTLNLYASESIYFSTDEQKLFLEISEDISFALDAMDAETERKQAKQALEKSREEFKELFNLAPIGYHEIDSEGRIIRMNETEMNMLGYKNDEPLGQYAWKFIKNESISQQSIIAKLKGQYKPTGIFERDYYRVDGSIVKALVTDIILKDKNEQITGIRTTVQDITDRKLAEELLKESEEKYRFMFANNPQPMFIYDLETLEFLEANQSAINHYGYSKEEIMSMSIKDIRPSEDVPAFMKDIEQAKRNKNTTVEWRHIKKSGETINVEVTAVPVMSNGKKARHILINDITERKQAESALKESEAKYREFVENSPEAISIYAEDKVVYVNNECVRLMRAKSKDELIGRPVIEYIHPDNRALVLERIQIVAETSIGTALPLVEEKYIRMDGTAIFVEVKAMPITLDNKPAVQLTARDITERKLIEEALEISRVELKTIYDNAPVMMCVVKENRSILFANHSFGAISKNFEKDMQKGHAFGGVIGCINSLENPHGCGYGKNCQKCVLRLAMEDTFKTGIGHKNIEYNSTLVFDDEQREVSFLGSTALINNHGKKNLLLCLHDITDRKLAEEALLESELRLHSMFEFSPISIWEEDFSLLKEWLNKLKREGVTDIRELFKCNPDLVNEAISLVKVLGINETSTKIFGTDTKDEITNNIPHFLFASDAFTEEIITLAEGKMRFEGETQITTLNGEIRHLLLTLTVMPGYEDTLSKVLVSFIDITARKEAEEALQKSEMFLRTFIENTPFEIWARDVNNVGILENRKMVEHFGSILGKTPLSFPLKDSNILELWNSNNKRVFGGEMIDEEIEYEFEQQLRTYQQIIFPINNNYNQIIGIAGFNIDITERKLAEEELKRSDMALNRQNQLFSLLLKNLPVGVFMVDAPSGKPLLANDVALHLLGQGINSEVNSHNLSEIYNIHKAGNGESYPTTELPIVLGMSGISAHVDDMVIKRSDGTQTLLEVFGSPVTDEQGNIWASLVSFSDITERKKAEKALNNSQEQLKKFASHLQNIREEERTGLAREIHDDLGQILIALKIDMGLLKQKVYKNIEKDSLEDISDKFNNLVGLIDNTIKTTRRIMTGLRPEVLELLGFVEAAKLYTHEFEDRHKISCLFVSTVSKLELSSQQSVALFRIIQEALTNVARHAKASIVNVQLGTQDNKLIMEIIDNGVGFDENHKVRQDSYGMIGMKERVFLLEGELLITSKTGKGTIVRIEMPYLIKS